MENTLEELIAAIREIEQRVDETVDLYTRIPRTRDIEQQQLVVKLEENVRLAHLRILQCRRRLGYYDENLENMMENIRGNFAHIYSQIGPSFFMYF